MSREHYNWRERITANLESRNEAIEEIYTNEKLRSGITTYVLSNSGDERMAKEVFTEAIVRFVKQCYKPGFKLKSDIEAYIFSIARNYYIRQAKRQKIKYTGDLRDMESYVDDPDEHSFLEEERKSLLDFALTQIGDKCRKVLTMWASSLKMREIALRMGYKSEGFARKKKHTCLEKLKSMIKDI